MLRSGILLIVGGCSLLAGMGLGRHHSAAAPAASTPLYWVDPMHPAYRAAKPGKAPDCGMDLVPVYPQDVASTLASQASGATLADPAVRSFYGVELTTVRPQPLHSTLHLFGQVQADDTRVFRVSLGAEGYVKDTQNDAPGSLVTRDQKLATVYAPEFLSVAGGYLSANERTTSASQAMRDNMAPTANAASAVARADRLRDLGMSDTQISEISRTRRIPEDVFLVAPSNGLILARNISRGMHFDRNATFYTIADLSHVWIAAQVSPHDALSLHPGMAATLSVPGTGRAFHARISTVLPQIDPETRSLNVRFEAENPGFSLRPDMAVNVAIELQHHAGLAVPVDAVLNTGTTHRVFVEQGEGHFVPREVRTGWTEADMVEITTGLSAGERVVSSGTFLVDSETRLRSDAGPQHGADHD